VVLDSLHVWDEILDLKTFGFLSITENSTLQVSAQLKDLAPVARLLNVDSLSARGTVGVICRGTVDSASLNATLRYENDSLFADFVRLDTAALQSASLGIAYDSIRINVLGDQERLLLDTLYVKGGDGVLTASDFVGKPTDYIDRVIREAEMTIRARRFLLANTRNFEMILDGDLGLVSAADSTALAGTLTILRSRFWLPAFFEQMKQRRGDESVPLLVQATRSHFTASTEAVDSIATERPPLAKNLTGTVAIKIPRNTWFHSPEMNVAIEGELDVVVCGDSIQFFVFVKVYRGTFIVYGKQFEVVEGRLDFRGGTNLVPSMTMEITYSFRGPSGQQEDLSSD
jgi:autotransporter translocation and assembly factor TamB